MQGSRKARAKFGLVAIVAGLSLVTAACADDGGSGGDSSSGKKLVYFMAPNTTPTRYIQQDGPDFEKAIKALDPDVEVKFVNGGGDSATQLSQANAAIAAGAKALVVVAADPNTSAGLLQAAATAKVPVIGYENPPLNGPLYAQVIFDPYKVGIQQAEYFKSQVEAGAFGSGSVDLARQYGNKGDVYTTEMLKGQDEVLKPLIDDGTLNVVCEDYIKDWAPDNAQKAAEQCLTKTQGKIDAFLGFYDGNASGIIAALKGKNADIPVYGGQNPELTGLQYLLTGDQQDTVLKAFSVEAEAAAKIALAAMKGEDPPSDLVKDEVNNGTDDIPTAKLDTTLIHLEDGKDPGEIVQQAVDLGIFTWEQICDGGPAASTPTCKAKVG
ncbi:substrate-binding domain-containing protein [Nocardioides sp. WV_118_6]|uniref:substrate-binding domain-containing protein n=1 Tax=Nocardioides simplex TaxID=2045 RepID=UPI00214FB012|nr:substrate-binding domain-containing protein [Pimelobacter simplex]UUW88099.1 substrate-binding domain-containing protein [Pimelobacter simplex]UUW97603.1 substrate-binding domain-containing protein [Pimelobacter simplex]